jgi:hypothetical protein
MLHWLTGSCRVFGLNGQNWMLVIAGALAAYIVVLGLLQRFRTH